MHPMTQLDQLRRHMVEELTQIPQYRALKTMERFIAEMAAIYDTTAPSVDVETEDAGHKIAQAIESHVKGEIAPAIVKNGAYVPMQRVA